MQLGVALQLGQAGEPRVAVAADVRAERNVGGAVLQYNISITQACCAAAHLLEGRLGGGGETTDVAVETVRLRPEDVLGGRAGGKRGVAGRGRASLALVVIKEVVDLETFHVCEGLAAVLTAQYGPSLLQK